MVGRRGPVPKPDDRRVGRGKRPDMKIVQGMQMAGQPPLDPSLDWPDQTRKWWAIWGKSPLTADFTAEEWAEFHDTAIIHAQFYQGRVALAGELRRRTAKYGVTPEDRLRLRIQFAFADTADEKAEAARERRKARAANTRARRGPLQDENAS